MTAESPDYRSPEYIVAERMRAAASNKQPRDPYTGEPVGKPRQYTYDRRGRIVKVEDAE